MTPGAAVGRFVVEKPLRGGVFVATDPRLERRVAVKLVAADRLAAAQALAQLADPNLAAVYEAGAAGDQVFLAMELVDGVGLAEWLAERPRDWRAILGIGVQAARGLAAAHDAGIAHGDLGPESVLVGRDGRVRLVGFSLGAGDADDQNRLRGLLRDALAPTGHVPRALDARQASVRALIARLEAALAPRWRRPAAALGVAALLALGWWTLKPARAPRCPPSAQRLAGVWDPARKEAMRVAFAKSVVVSAPQQFAAVERAIDGYAASWAEKADAACRADDAAAPLRRACLDERLDGLRAWVTVFTTSDARLIAQAPQSAEGRDELACSDAMSLNRLRPADPELAAKIEPLRARMIAEIERTNAGNFKPALEALREILAEARALGYGPLVGEVLVALGDAEPDPATALAEFVEARDLGEEERYDLLRVNAWRGIATADEFLGHHDQSAEALRAARAILRRTGGPLLPRLETALLGNQAAIFANQGRLTEAFLLYSHALIERSVLAPGDSWTAAVLLADEGAVLVALGRSAEGRAVLDRTLKIVHGLGGDENPLAGRVYNSLADDAARRGDHRQAVTYLEKSLDIKARAGMPKQSVSRAISLANLGEAHLALGELDAAEAAAGEARDILASRVPHSGSLAQALFVLARVQVERKQPAAAVALLEQALPIAVENRGVDVNVEEAKLLLARALWDSGGDKPRARVLAAEARAGYTAAGNAAGVSAVDAWLATTSRRAIGR